VPALRKELDILVGNFAYLQKNIDSLKEFAKFHNINSKEEMNSFLLTCEPQYKEQVMNTTQNILFALKSWSSMLLEYVLNQATISAFYNNIKDDINVIKAFTAEKNLSLEKNFSTSYQEFLTHTSWEMCQKLFQSFEAVRATISIAETGPKGPLTLVPSELLVNAIIEVNNNYFNQLHNYSENFYLIRFHYLNYSKQLKDFIISKIETNQSFEIPIIFSWGGHFEPIVIQYKNNTLSAFHIGDEDVSLSFLADITKSLTTEISTKSYYTQNYWQSDTTSCFSFAINFLKDMIEDIHDSEITLYEAESDNHIEQNNINKLASFLRFQAKDLKYFEYTQSLSTIQEAINRVGDLPYNQETNGKLSDIIKNSPITVQPGDIELQAKPMNFAIYESAYKLYSETQEMFNSHSDSEIAGFILAHQFPEPEALVTNLTGTIHPICAEAA
jgi:hypothetical protein